jgi:hypothetical protein
VAWLEPEAIKQLNLYAIQHDRKVQDILVEAINDWFAKQGLPHLTLSASSPADMKTGKHVFMLASCYYIETRQVGCQISHRSCCA